jgi:hypothetical protein
MDKHELTCCDVQIIDPEIALLTIFDHINELSRENLLDVEGLLSRLMNNPFGVISDGRGVDYSFSSDAIKHLLHSTGFTVIATISDNTFRTKDLLWVLNESSIHHEVFPTIDQAIPWVKRILSAPA